jgi:pyruvate/2-oxoglutarate dehydrogenase complex dihydrolipoamide dehydrogenase (E3) component
MSAAPTHYDTIIIGSGQGGIPFALASAAAGKRTLLIECSHLGGCCVNVGCTPTKTLISSGRIAYLARRAGEYGIHFPGTQDGEVTVDMLRVRERKREIVASFRGGSERRAFAAKGLDVLYGKARFVGQKTLVVEPVPGDGVEHVAGMEVVKSATTVEGDTIVVNVGERPARSVVKGIEGVPEERVLDSTTIQELGVVPAHLAVLGGESTIYGNRLLSGSSDGIHIISVRRIRWTRVCPAFPPPWLYCHHHSAWFAASPARRCRYSIADARHPC